MAKEFTQNSMRILLIVSPDREDFYNYLKQDEQSEYLLLWHEKKEIDQKKYSFFRQEFYWSDYATPLALIQSIKPDKIVLFEIIDQRQMALIVTANAKGITTFYLEHGAAADKDTALERSKATLDFYKKRGGYILNRLFFGLGSLLKTKFFYFSAVRFIKSFTSRIKYIRLPFAMQYATPNKALKRISFPERIPYYAITFNENNFEEYQLYTNTDPQNALYTGVPMFDSYYQPKSIVAEKTIVYIEHPYLESDLLDWNEAFHKKIAETLFRFANETKTPVLVKLHPRSDLKLWQSYNLQSEYFEIVQQGNYTNRYLAASIILGYSSSLITGLLCAKKNIVLLGWHPQPRIFGSDFSKTGLCHTSMNMQDLFTQMDFWLKNNLTIQQTDLYNNFLKKYNHPFDGRAAERVVHAIRTL